MIDWDRLEKHNTIIDIGFKYVLKDLHNDRAIVIVISAMLQDALREVLIHKFDDPIQAMLTDYGKLGGFSDTISLAKATRVIDEEAFDALKQIARIRNRFAHDVAFMHQEGGEHKWKVATFDSQQIRGMCQELKFEEVTSSDARARFVVISLTIVQRLSKMLVGIVKSRLPPPLPLAPPKTSENDQQKEI